MASNTSSAGYKAVKSVLKEELVTGGIIAQPAKLLGFLSALQSGYSSLWSQADLWEEPLITSTVSLGGVEFRTITEPASPAQLVHAATEIIEEEWDVVEEHFESFDVDLPSAEQFLQSAHTAQSATEASNSLKALIASLSAPDSQKNQSQIKELPLTNEFLALRQKNLTLEKKWIQSLELQEAGEQLEQTLNAQAKEKDRLKNLWTPQQEQKLQETRKVIQEWQDWQEQVQRERKQVVTNALVEASSPTFAYVKKEDFLEIFFEHNPKFAPASDSAAVVVQAQQFWKILSEADVTKGDPKFYFEQSVMAAYEKFGQNLERKLQELTPTAQALTARILLVISPSAATTQPTAPAPGGVETETPEDSDSDRTTRQNRRWQLLLERLEKLNQGITGVPNPETLSGISTSLQRFASSIGVSAPESNLSRLVAQFLGVGFESWATGKSADEVDTILDSFVTLLEANEALLQQAQKSDVTPGEAAKKAQELQDEQAKSSQAAPKTNTPDEIDRTQLKDLSKLHHAHAALTGIAISELEQLLLKKGYSKTEVEKYLTENQPALAQYLWTQYLAQLQNGTDSNLSSNEVFKLALNGSLFFLDKLELEKGLRSEALGPNSLQQGKTGELSPEMLKRLGDVAQMYGYDSADEMFVALFGNGDKAQARADFIRRAEYAATLTPEKIAAFSRSLVEQYLGKSQLQTGDSLIERLMASLERDQYSLEQLFFQNPDSLSPSQKSGWRELGKLLKRYSSGQTLTPKDLAKMDQLLLEMAPVLVLYMNLGPEFYTLRQGNGFRTFLTEASRYGEMENQQAEASGTAAIYHRLIPQEFYKPGTPVMALRLKTETTQITVTRRTRVSRDNIALQAMIAMSLAQQSAANSYEEAYLNMVAQQMAEAGIQNLPGNLAATQSHSPWTSSTAQQAGNGAVNQLTAQAAGRSGAKGGLPGVGNWLKNPIVRKAIIAALPNLGIGVVGLALVKQLLDTFPFLQSFLPSFGGTAATGASVASTAATSGVASGLGSAVGTAVADGSSQAAIAAKSAAQGISETVGGGLTTTGTAVSAGLTAITTTASTSAAIVATGIVAPLLGMVLTTILVWAVIGNSFNDYSSLKSVQGVGKNYCAEDNPSVAATAKGIVGDLQQGWWKYYNRHPAYPELFNTATYNAYPNKNGMSVNGYTEPDYYIVQPQSANTQRDLFWCTWLVVKAYQINNLPIGEHIYVPTMLAKWSAGPVVKNDADVPGGANIQDEPISAQSIPLGAAVFFGKDKTQHAGNSVPGGAHVAIVCDITFDDAAKTTGTLTTCDSNNYKTLNEFNIINGVVQDSDTLRVDYFGLPGEIAPSCNATPTTPVSLIQPNTQN